LTPVCAAVAIGAGAMLQEAAATAAMIKAIIEKTRGAVVNLAIICSKILTSGLTYYFR
jgi:hypothetical protein